MVREQKHAKSPRHSVGYILMVTFLLSVFLVILTFAALYFSGIRYLKKNFDDGSYVKFLGKVDDFGAPVSGKLYYSDGSTAKINIKDSTVTYSGGTVYRGPLVDLQRNGNGTVTFANGDSYTGSFVNDKLTGKGTYIFANGDTYEGDFKNGKKDGYGKYTVNADGSVYEGDFKNDAKHGNGTYTWADGSSYRGIYYNDLKHGNGVFTFANGDIYTGQFVSDVRTGVGTYLWADSGDCYEGEFLNNLMNGWGTYTWSSGRIYEGLFQNGVIVRVDNTPTTPSDPLETPQEAQDTPTP